MPFTVFHLGPAVLFGLLLYRYLDLPTFVAANVVVDLRAAVIFVGLWEGQIHGPMQTFLGATLTAVVLAAAVHWFYPWIQQVMRQVGLEQVRQRRRILAAAVAGTWLHVVMDAMLWPDMQPFAPSMWNPFLGVVAVDTMYAFTIAAGVLAVPVYLYGLYAGWYPEPV
ncbi:MAG: hypothetical protein ABEI97_00590 [Candidatus Nanohaloarchaea archaeon]